MSLSRSLDAIPHKRLVRHVLIRQLVAPTRRDYYGCVAQLDYYAMHPAGVHPLLCAWPRQSGLLVALYRPVSL